MKTERTQNQNDIPETTPAEIEQGWENTKDAVSDAAEDVSDATKKAYENTKEALNGDDSPEFETVSVDTRMTANGMIGKPVYNQNGERVAKVQDIILDRDGNAMMVVMGDGDFTGLGKTVAFDYSVIANRSADGDVIAALTEDMIDTAASFSYDREDYSDTVKVIPSNGYSVAELLDGELVNPQGETLAEVDNISLRNGEADRLIVGFGRVLGMGGDTAALDYDDANIVRQDNALNFELTADAAAQFERFKSSALEQ